VINKFWAYRQKNIPQNAKVPEKTDDITVEEHTETKEAERS
jgi:hypothetical protein